MFTPSHQMVLCAPFALQLFYSAPTLTRYSPTLPAPHNPSRCTCSWSKGSHVPLTPERHPKIHQPTTLSGCLCDKATPSAVT
jgi:hypothetical protein